MRTTIKVMIVSERPIDSTGPWPRQEEQNHIFAQYEQVEFYADDDDTSATVVYEVNNDYDLYYLIIAALQFETTTQITIDTEEE